jgi:putative ABC transport system substrate-binding protein
MLQAKADVIVAVGGLPARAAKAATTSVPIVMLGNFDPIEIGLVENLARPGANLTGVLIAPDGTLASKRLELLSLAVPRAKRIALLMPAPADRHPQVQETRKAASLLGIELIVAEVHGGDYAGAFAAMQAGRPGALLVGATQYFARPADRKQIIELAAKHRLPAMYEWRDHVADGGLMTYSTSQFGLSQRVAAYIDRILKGARPGELPIERPSTFQFVVNLKTAKALGLTLPSSLMLRVDEVIE